MLVISQSEGSLVNLERIWRQIESIKAWYKASDVSERGEQREILKPLNKIINFETQELISKNHFYI